MGCATPAGTSQIALEDAFRDECLDKLTECQYSATCLRPNISQMYTRFRMSFWKQLPPKPTEAERNLGPTRESVPIECATCSSAILRCAFTAEVLLSLSQASMAGMPSVFKKHRR